MSIEASAARSGPRPRARGGAPGYGASATAVTALSAVDLTLSFGQRGNLSGVAADVRRGAVTTLTGPAGSGQPTPVRTFNRINDKVSSYRHSGDVLLDG